MIWSIMEAHALPHDAAANAWTVMLLAAAYLEGAAFMTGKWQRLLVLCPWMLVWLLEPTLGPPTGLMYSYVHPMIGCTGVLSKPQH